MRSFVASDIEALMGWYAAHGKGAPSTDMIARLGLIVPDVAAGFLYLTNAPGLALIEGIVTNPKAPLRARAEGLDKIIVSLIQIAKQRGVRHLVGFASSRGLERRIQKLGWRSVGIYAGVALEI